MEQEEETLVGGGGKLSADSVQGCEMLNARLLALSYKCIHFGTFIPFLLRFSFHKLLETKKKTHPECVRMR